MQADGRAERWTGMAVAAGSSGSTAKITVAEGSPGDPEDDIEDNGSRKEDHSGKCRSSEAQEASDSWVLQTACGDTLRPLKFQQEPTGHHKAQRPAIAIADEKLSRHTQK